MYLNVAELNKLGISIGFICGLGVDTRVFSIFFENFH